jgi:hypothetical protein
LKREAASPQAAHLLGEASRPAHDHGGFLRERECGEASVDVLCSLRKAGRLMQQRANIVLDRHTAEELDLFTLTDEDGMVYLTGQDLRWLCFVAGPAMLTEHAPLERGNYPTKEDDLIGEIKDGPE